MTDEIRRALEEFVETIDATGGVTESDEGFTVPVADEDWIDLGEAYVKACLALGVEPNAGVVS